MGKPTPSSVKIKSNMAEGISERRKAFDPLKRSKSVRASLRFIGHKLLHHKPNDDSITKVKSLSNLTDFKNKRDFKRSISHDDSQSLIFSLPDIYVREPLKPNSRNSPIERDKKTKIKQKDKYKITTPPALIAPKAAQLLQIPIKENSEPVSLQREPFLRNSNNFVSDENDNISSECFHYEYRRNTFNRNTFRLSLAPSKKKNFRYSSSIEGPSKYLIIRLILCLRFRIGKSSHSTINF